MIALLLACGADLPAGWEGAVPIRDLTQAECAGDPYGVTNERIEVDFTADPVRVEYREAHFRCAQDVEGFARSDADRLDLLVQPIDMHPSAVASCDCLYDVSIGVAEYDGTPGVVSLYRRWDDLNDPNDPVLIGTTPSP